MLIYNAVNTAVSLYLKTQPMKTWLLPFCVLLLLPTLLTAQRVMQIETYGSPKTEKIYPGTEITYRLRNDDIWYTGYIEDFMVRENVIVFPDRFINVDSITALRFQRSWPDKVGSTLLTFGAGWSVFAAIGTATDGNPDTRYQWSDAIVTASSAGIGFALPRLFRNRKVKINSRKKRLRLLDLNFKKE